MTSTNHHTHTNSTTTKATISKRAQPSSNHDATYTQKLAQRCTARAALHLGIETITNDVLYALSDALLFYMEQVASYISHFVERDGYGINNVNVKSSRNHLTGGDNDHEAGRGNNVGKRWSGHVNVFDLLHAIECCTSQALDQVDITDDTTMNGIPNIGGGILNHAVGGGAGGSGNNFMTNSQQKDGNSVYNHWEGLAEFLFGKDWSSIDLAPRKKPSIATASNNGAENSSATKATAAVGADATKTTGSSTVPIAAAADNTANPGNTQVAVRGSKSVGKKLNIPSASSSSALAGTTTTNTATFQPQNQIENGNGDESSSNLQLGGWNAPYPEDIPMYPVRKQAKIFDSLANANQACRDTLKTGTLGKNTKIRNSNLGSITPKMKSSSIGNNHKKTEQTKNSKDTTTSSSDQKDHELEKQIGFIPDHVFLDGITSFWGTSTDSTLRQKQQGLAGQDFNNQKLDGTMMSSNPKDGENATAAGAAQTSKSNKRKRNESLNDTQKAKKSKHSTNVSGALGDQGNNLADASRNGNNRNTNLPSYVPNFFPPFPPPETYLPPTNKNATSSSTSLLSSSSMLHNYDHLNSSSGSTAKDATATTISPAAAMSSASSTTIPSSTERPQQQNATVRSALVSLGQNVGKSYWGQITHDHHQKNRDLSIANIQVRTAKIPNIAASNHHASMVNNSAANANRRIVAGQEQSKNGLSVVPVQPMAKASSYRTSRILEGSIDTSN